MTGRRCSNRWNSGRVTSWRIDIIARTLIDGGWRNIYCRKSAISWNMNQLYHGLCLIGKPWSFTTFSGVIHWHLMEPTKTNMSAMVLNYNRLGAPLFWQPFTKRSWAGMQLVAAYWAGNHFCFQLLNLPLSLCNWLITKSRIFNLAQICLNEGAANVNN